MLNYPASLDLMFQALADPTRRDMVLRLGTGPASVSELAKPLEMSFSAVMQHLRVLEESGLVRTNKIGRVRTCELQPAALSSAEGWLNQLRTTWEGRLDRLERYLATPPTDKENR